MMTLEEFVEEPPTYGPRIDLKARLRLTAAVVTAEELGPAVDNYRGGFIDALLLAQEHGIPDLDPSGDLCKADDGG